MKADTNNLGILAHVDSGKTTLCECILYKAGSIRKMGRVDHQDTFLDTDSMERKRGITIFSKQARLEWEGEKFTLIDTPGHVDFSSEMERTLQVLDYAVLLVSGASGVQSHTKTLWNLLERYNIPTFIFVNKMDQPETDAGKLMDNLKSKINDRCVRFELNNTDNTYVESIAEVDETLMEEYLESEALKEDSIKEAIFDRRLFPVFFGSALKDDGVDALLNALATLTIKKEYPDSFQARVYKIERDEQNNRITHLKITGGSIKVKALIDEEKVDQIRLYSGDSFDTTDEAKAGTICSVTGLSKTFAGAGLGEEKNVKLPLIEPVMTYKVTFADTVNPFLMYGKLKALEEEDPSLHILWNEKFKEIHMQIMGEVQIEILKNIIMEKFHEEAAFDSGSIVYKETVKEATVGIGHFEPLRHYAEVHIQIEPLERGSGIEYATNVSEDILDRNWQRLILTNLEEKVHKGVLTGSDLTDVRYTIINGRAHLKHTEGGDFRQATYRAVRQGLMSGTSMLLEPYYDFTLEVPKENLGRAMTDINKMSGTMGEPFIENDMAVLFGTCPVSTMKNYSNEVISYTRGEGRISYQLKGYDVCHNEEEILQKINYNPEADLANTPDSVFCAHGAGFVVPWYEVPDYAHLEDEEEYELNEENVSRYVKKSSFEDGVIGQDEIDEIMNRTYGASKQKRTKWAKTVSKTESHYVGKETSYSEKKSKKEYLLVDGYNIIFAWKELQELAAVNIDSARDKLMDILCNYQGFVQCELILVFDAYKVSGGKGSVFDYHNIHVVYTKEAQTADAYIEKTAHELSKSYNVKVATSDRLEQMIIFGAGATRVSARGFLEEIEKTTQTIRTFI